MRPATLEDIELLARIAAEGFYDDPVLSWVLQDDTTRLGQMIVMFKGLVEDMLPDRGAVYLADAACAAFWRDPTFEHGQSASDRMEEAAAEDGPGPFTEDEQARMTILGDAMREAHPHEPHWYLNVVSTLPSHQSQGLGAAVLEPVIQRADAEGMPCYLESSNPRNRTLYYRSGFEDRGDIEPDGGPPLRKMWRDPVT